MYVMWFLFELLQMASIANINHVYICLNNFFINVKVSRASCLVKIYWVWY